MKKTLLITLFTCVGLIALAQTPTITSFSPTSGTAGTSMTITGTNFNTTAANNKVFIGSVPANVSSASATQLVVTVPAAASGVSKLRVTNTGTACTFTSDGYFITTFTGGIAPGSAVNTQFPTPNFIPGINPNGDAFSIASGFKTVAGDFDGDGKIDYATMNISSLTMQVNRNTTPAGGVLTTSNFPVAATLTLDANSTSIAPYIEDIDSDGKPDIVVGRTTGFTIFRNTSTGNGSIAFAKTTVNATSTYASQKVITGDMDKDGKPEVIGINMSSAVVSIFKNTTSGATISFTTAPTNSTSAVNVGDVIAADLDGDGDKDLAITSHDAATNQRLYYIRNNNTTAGTLAIAASPTVIYSTLPVGNYSGPVGLTGGDFDNDGDVDLVTVSKGGASAVPMLYIHRNDGSLTFTSFSTGNFANTTNITMSVRTADMNGDGKLDIVFALQNTGGVAVVLNNYSSGSLVAGSFSDYSMTSLTLTMTGLCVEDMNNDGKVDILGSNHFYTNTSIVPSGMYVYFPKAANANNINSTSSWSSSEDGTSTVAPSSFASNYNMIFNNSAGTTSFGIGSAWTVNGPLTIPAGVTFNASVYGVTLGSHVTNNGTITGTVAWLLNGSAAQTIGGSGNYNNISVNNTAGVSLANAVSVNNLTLTNGTVNTGTFTLTVRGNIARTSGSIDATAGAVQMNGSVAQTLSPAWFSGAINNLEINNTAGVTLTGNITAGTLSLTNGIVTLDANNITATSNVVGGSGTAYIRTNGTGLMKATINNAVTTNLAVGNSSYNPLSITNNTGAADEFSVGVVDQLYNNGVNGSIYQGTRVNRIWNINKTNPNGGSGVNLLFNWSAAEAPGIANPGMYHHNGTRWELQTGTTVGGATNLTYSQYTGTFSPFAIAETTGTLPVTWLSFTAQLLNNEVSLQWSTAAEQNNSFFTVQHSTDAINWKNIATVTGGGNSNTVQKYGYLHTNAQNGINHYRIQQTDVNGMTSFSKINTVKLSTTASMLRVLNTSVDNGHLSLQVNRSVKIFLYNNDGKLVLQKQLEPGTQEINVSHFTKGIYILKSAEETTRILIR